MSQGEQPQEKQTCQHLDRVHPASKTVGKYVLVAEASQSVEFCCGGWNKLIRDWMLTLFCFTSSCQEQLSVGVLGSKAWRTET